AGAAPVEVDLKKPVPPKEKPLVKRNAQWRYRVGASAPAAWNTPTFDASKWNVGTSGFGYGDNLEKTTLPMRGKHAVVYIRTEFQVPNPEQIKGLSLGINYDDGFVAYLNGKEVVRKGVEGQGASATNIVSHEAKGHETFSIPMPAGRLRKGKNILAIEGHNVRLTSSDFLLDPYLFVPEAMNAPLSSAGRFLSLVRLINNPSGDRYGSSSRKLMVLNRHSGEVLWSRDAVYNFRHNAIAVGDGKIFCLDAMTAPRLARFRRRGFEPQEPPVLYALDARTGEVLWKTQSDVFGTWLSYSAKHDVVVQAGSASRDRARDEISKGIVVYRGGTGEVVWKDLSSQHGGPLILWRDELITNGNAGMGLDLMTGKPTGWQWSRKYGCNTAIAGQHLLTFRSGAAGYYDLATRSGTGNLGGFKSSCTSNLIPADGVLNAPDYTRTCSCSYQNQASLALIHMPDMEMWTFGGQPAKNGSRGFNLGAPGERRSPSGTLWTPVTEEGAEGVTVEAAGVFCQHAMLLEGEALPWVAASGLRGVSSIVVNVPAGTYTVRLHFSEPEAVEAGARVFDVSLQGKPVLRDFDVMEIAGAPNRALTRQFEDVVVEQSIELGFIAKQGDPILCGLELIPKQP
ncbi:MAG: PQQ-binding-like beta-propeller repeat protein, partial [Verrucomicrobia bacterium]|nr:PQQ-binding-like beta-propeller repeat protein [Verrucomicrobiota bacterium]